MAHFSSKVTVILDEELLINAPSCPHGPTVIFERETQSGKKAFYACAAYRDRKLCDFYQLISENGISVKQKPHSQCALANSEEASKRFRNLWRKFQKLPEGDRKFCKNCGEPVGQDLSKHKDHVIMNGIPDEILNHPTVLLGQVKDNKGIAQFHFDDKSIKVLKEIIKKLEVSHVLCIGVPSLYEELLETSGISCFLLDIDQRLMRLCPTTSACLYNMFNNQVLDHSEGLSSYQKFLNSARENDSSGSKFLVIVDPPFGGMAELLLRGLRKLSADFYQGSLTDNMVQTLVAFPYFLEKHIVKDGSFKMVDMEVTYKNHTKLGKRKAGDDRNSVVKLYTNMPLSKVVLPTELGYRFCRACKKYVSKQNKHCFKCKTCPTKAGKTYKHCGICKKCVKPNWKHCEECNICELPGRHTKKARLDEEDEEEMNE